MLDIVFEAEPEYQPQFAHHTDAGADLKTTHVFDIKPGELVTVETGVKVNIPAGHVGYLHVRSSLAFKYGIQLVNGTGVIDTGFIGEIKARLVNHGDKAIAFDRGDRVVQLVIHELPAIRYRRGTIHRTERGENGFGSTGR